MAERFVLVMAGFFFSIAHWFWTSTISSIVTTLHIVINYKPEYSCPAKALSLCEIHCTSLLTIHTLFQADTPKFSKNKCQQWCNSDKLKWRMFLTVYGSKCQCTTFLIWGKAQVSWLLGPLIVSIPRTTKASWSLPFTREDARSKTLCLRTCWFDWALTFRYFTDSQESGLHPCYN